MNTITIPSNLEGFINTETRVGTTLSNRGIYLINGKLEDRDNPECFKCGCKMHIHGTVDVNLAHLPIGPTFSAVRFEKKRFKCPVCGRTEVECIIFQAGGHRITVPLLNFTIDLLKYGFTLKEVSRITGLGKNTIKDIDKKRLHEKYAESTSGGELVLKRPDVQARNLGIDEFKLHDGYVFATVIIDLDSGHVLWLAHGKRKKAVYDFIDYVGEKWMDNVEAVACDMNSDYQHAFEERCPYIQVVFDYFHIKKNFNEKVINAIKKDESKRLIATGSVQAAASLKRSRYILCSSRKTLEAKDEKANKISLSGLGFEKQEPKLFEGGARKVFRNDNLERYEKILKENKLLFTADLVKEKLSDAYTMKDEAEMAESVSEIIDMCRQTRNKHFVWFAKLLEDHFEGIIAHASLEFSSGKVEGTNNLIKTIRRRGYGYPDDDYFFLKIMDQSRKTYVRNEKSHRICD